MTLDGWSSKTIGELCNFSNGCGFRPSDWSKEGLPIIRIQNLNGSKEFNYFNGIPDASWLVEPGTILFAWAGTRGVSFGPTIWSGPRGVLNQHIYRIHPHKEVNPLWLYVALEFATKNIERNAHGFKATLLHVRKEEITSQVVLFPPLCEQQKIVTVLSNTDSLIESLDKLIAKKRGIKQATMQQLLTGKTRLPGFGRELKPGYKQTEVGLIPEDWKIEKLGNCLLDAPQYGVNAPAVQHTDDLPIYIRITDITDDGCFSPEKIASVRHVSVDKYVLKAGDLVFARTGASVGKTYLYKPEDGNLVFAGYLIRVEVNPSKLLPDYLAAYVKTQHYWSWVKAMSMRSGQPGINGNEYAQLSISLPSPSEQQAIATVLSDMDAEIAALEQRRDKTRALKRGMMQELLTGKTRLL